MNFSDWEFDRYFLVLWNLVELEILDIIALDCFFREMTGRFLGIVWSWNYWLFILPHFLSILCTSFSRLWGRLVFFLIFDALEFPTSLVFNVILESFLFPFFNFLLYEYYIFMWIYYCGKFLLIFICILFLLFNYL